MVVLGNLQDMNSRNWSGSLLAGASHISAEHEQDFLHICLEPRTVRHAGNPLLTGHGL